MDRRTLPTALTKLLLSSNHDAAPGDYHPGVLADLEACGLQPVAAQSQVGHLPGLEAAVLFLGAAFVVLAADFQDARFERGSDLLGHDDLLRFVLSISPPVQRGGRVLEHGRRAARSFSLSGLA